MTDSILAVCATVRRLKSEGSGNNRFNRALSSGDCALNATEITVQPTPLALRCVCLGYAQARAFK